jgi:type II secretory pathway pseudopilin PulG
VKKESTTGNSETQMPDLVGRASTRAGLGAPNFCERGSSGASPHLVAFTLIEVLVVMVLLSLIVLALMTVFNSTQTAFRASMTQADVLEGGRATMDLITADLKGMSPSFGRSNVLTVSSFPAAVNFYANANSGYAPLTNSLVGSTNTRTNILENFFILSSGNQNGVPTWYGTGYAVITNAPGGSPVYALYRFSTNYPMAAAGAVSNLFNRDFFVNFLNAPTNYSHLIDGVVELRVRAYDVNGVWLTNGYAFGQSASLKNVLFLPPAFGEVGFYMFSNSLPGSVEIEMATLEDRTLQHAESLPGGGPRDNYLKNQAGKVHVFRQRVSIPNVDLSAYQ